MRKPSVQPETGVNAYATIAQADQWFVIRSRVGWVEANVSKRSGALIRAAEWLDGYFRFRGERVSASQMRAWPRKGTAGMSASQINGLPAPVEQAYFELALALIESEAAAEQLLGIRGGVRRERIGSVAVEYEPAQVGRSRVLALLWPYLKDSVAPKVVRA